MSIVNIGEARQEPQDQTGGSSNLQRRCWECLRRRLVCDLKRPACGKCNRAGILCPGYGEQKPLTWLRPGTVKSKTPMRTNRLGALNNNNPPAISVGNESVSLTASGSASRPGNQDSGDIHNQKLSSVPRFKMQDRVTNLVQVAVFCKSLHGARNRDRRSFTLEHVFWLLRHTMLAVSYCAPGRHAHYLLQTTTRWLLCTQRRICGQIGSSSH